MIVAVCLDDRDGLLFLKRRLSRDRAVGAQLQKLSAHTRLLLSSYSAKVYDLGATVCEDFLAQAGPGDICFVENADVLPWQDKLEKLIVFRWNRHYPSDVAFPLAQVTQQMQLTERLEFPGSSHDVITQEVYSK